MVSEYVLKLKLNINDRWLRGSSRVTIVDHSGRPIDTIRFILNHGLKPIDVKGECINKWRWYRKSLSDLRDLIVNVIEIIYDKLPRKDKRIELTIDYEGSIKDYSNVFPYVKDCIGEYTFIRTDAYSYPILLVNGLKFHDLVSSVINQRFKYRIEVDVPQGYVVANVGKLVNHKIKDEYETYVYVSKVPSWRIDIAIAKFEVLEEKENDLKVFYLPEDKEYAIRILDALKNCLKYYKELFGKPVRWNGYTIIELPETWGSQADYTGMLLERKSFADPYHVGVYHELAHLWNAQSAEQPPSRFLDEGFASYFQLLAERRFIGDKWFKKRLRKAREKLKDLVKKTPKLLEVPLADYGRYYLTDASYLVGALLLYVLHRLVGDQCFYKAIRRFLEKYYERPATLESFIETFVEVCGSKIRSFLEEWLYTTKPVKLIIEKDVDEVVEQYRRTLK
ncbi:MAG: hypothetical protein DRN78_00525 [Thermoproteota archaeon]|nr:MAG: hypothetical protein DRN78_00525 [Candidatus Korarchaeota archaeon]